MSQQKTPISWSAPEFRHYEKGFAWYLTLVIASALIVTFFIVVEKDVFAAVCIAILAVMVGLFTLQRPRIVEVTLDSQGVNFGSVFYPYKQLRNFWIVDNENHHTLNFEPSTVIKHVIVIELMDEPTEIIRQFLLPYVPEHHLTSETFAQRISHRLKF